VQASEATFSWSAQGGNSLGTLLVYARSAADWMLSLTSRNRRVKVRSSSDLPHFARDPNHMFPFAHYEFWADTQPNQLQDFAEQFNLIIKQLERARLPEIRNGLDHFREGDEFPSTESIIACERYLSDLMDIADQKRFIPKVFWLSERRTDEFGVIKYHLRDYNGRELMLNGPAIVSGIPGPSFTVPWIVPYGNLLGFANSDLIFRLAEESSYSKMWENYPARRNYRAAVEGDQAQMTNSGGIQV
jgi:hypothetical protein